MLPLALVASLATLAAAAGLGLVSAGLAGFSTLPFAVAGFSAFGFSAAFGFSVFPDFYKENCNQFINLDALLTCFLTTVRCIEVM